MKYQRKKDLKTLNTPIIINELEAEVKTLPTKKSLVPDGFIDKFYKNVRKALNTPQTL